MTFNITFDYRFDSTGFYTADVRAALEEAARIWEGIVSDEFDDVPVGTAFTVDNPSDSGNDMAVVLDAPIDDLMIFMGAELLGGPLANGGFDGVDASGDILRARITNNWRGTGPVTDFEPWAGTITFDPTINWSFDISGPVSGRNDFLSTALHEIGHVMGVGTASIFDQIGAGGSFDGPNSVRVNGGSGIPLVADLSHVVDGFEGDTVLMDPTSTTGSRKLPTDIDRALLADIGYEIAGFTKEGFTPPIVTEGDDITVFGQNVADVIDGLGGNDQIQGSHGDDTLSGGAGEDTLFGGSDDDLLDGGAGDDQLQGGTGDDTLVGGAGSDTLFGQDGTDTYRVIQGGGQIRVVGFDLATEVAELIDSGFASAAAVVAALTKPFSNVSRLTLPDGTRLDISHDSQSGSPLTEANFRLVGTSDPNAPQSLTGTSGDDVLTGAGGNDTITGLSGADTLSGLAGNDMIDGGAGDDSLADGAGNDTLSGGAGDDILFNGGGSDVFDGGAGRDRLITDVTGLTTDTLSVDLAAGTHGRLGGSQDTLTGIEDFTMIGGWDAILVGSTGNNRLEAGSGNDTLRGGDGADTLLGGAGNDVITGGATTADLRDVMFGGAGNDTIDGGYGNDELRGDAGNDNIAGGFGADTVIGGTGNDTLTGSAFGDEIFGGDGMDFVNGGFGSDRVNGGAGADTFFHLGIRDHGNDWIQDYSAADGDILLFGGAATADQFQINVANTASAGDAGTSEAFVIYRPTGQIIWALVDGMGEAAITLRVGGVETDLLA
ncbi:hypothetical protein [Jannaschia sp. 2305UL9-9]|uniref:hypothetical protein n=1 Tax=Jannaschia sp. 2305UL9-9 TaxID=3121638 RepID=UPI0035289474